MYFRLALCLEHSMNLKKNVVVENVVNQSYWNLEKLIAAKTAIGYVRVVVSMTNEQRICKA